MFHIKIIDHNHYFRLRTPRTTKKLQNTEICVFCCFYGPIPNGDLQYLFKKTFWCLILRQKRESSFLHSNFYVCPMLDRAGVRPDRGFFFFKWY
jgi:hypothetical protein